MDLPPVPTVYKQDNEFTERPAPVLHPAGEVQGREPSRVNCDTIKSMCWGPGLDRPESCSPSLWITGFHRAPAEIAYG